MLRTLEGVGACGCRRVMQPAVGLHQNQDWDAVLWVFVYLLKTKTPVSRVCEDRSRGLMD